MIKLAITNLGRYNEGWLVYEWLTLPYVDGELEELLEGIGINEHYEEFFISDYESELNINISEWANVNQLNDMMQELESLDADIDVVNGIIEHYTGDIDEVINILRSGNYSVLYGVKSYYDLGYDLIEAFYPEAMELGISGYINYTRYGEDSGYNLIDGNKALLVY